MKLALVLLMSAVGCQQGRPPKPEPTPRPLTKGEYVAKYRCDPENVTGGFAYYSDDGTVKTADISVSYLCPNGIHVSIDAGR